MLISTRRLATTFVAACLATGLAVAPAASAADGGSGTKAAAAQKKKAKGPTTRKLNTDLRKVRTRTTKAERTIRSLDKTLKQLDALAKGADGKANTLLSAAPQLISGLTQLGDAVTKQIAPGLTQLSDAVQKQIAPGLKQAGESITNLAVAQEYGVVQAFLNDTAATGQILTSSDIPDDGNAAILSGVATIQIPPNAASVPVKLRAAVRSGEADGTAADDPVASAGLVNMTVEPASPGVTVGGGLGAPLGPDAGVASKQPAADAPPVYPIAIKAPRSDTPANPFAFPSGDGQSIELTDPATLFNAGTGVGRLTVSAGPGGGIALVRYTARFHDLTASATDLTE